MLKDNCDFLAGFESSFRQGEPIRLIAQMRKQ
jgi:hypothetical protein